MEVIDKLYYERLMQSEGCSYIAGIDEVGRGPLCGPVMCAIVIMPLDDIIEGIDDSKKLSKKKRELLFVVLSGSPEPSESNINKLALFV